MHGEGLRLWDLTFRKNIRFAGNLLSVGVDVYDLFSSDAALNYQNTYTACRLADGTWVSDNPATAAVELNDWNRVTGITNPRFARFSLTFDFQSRTAEQHPARGRRAGWFAQSLPFPRSCGSAGAVVCT